MIYSCIPKEHTHSIPYVVCAHLQVWTQTGVNLQETDPDLSTEQAVATPAMVSVATPTKVAAVGRYRYPYNTTILASVGGRKKANLSSAGIEQPTN